MSRQYVGQVNNQNFVYPNYEMTEYDVEIVHDINNRCISGTVTSFSATTVSSSSITFTYNGSFNFNGTDPFKGPIITPIINVPYLSVHCQVPNQTYMNTWRIVDTRGTTYLPPTLPTTGSWTGDTFTITPAQYGLASFSSGTYFFEFRFIAEKCLYKICSAVNINITTPTPTPTPTPTATPGPTPTPQNPCYCYEIVVTGSTLPPPEGGTIASLDYNDCNGVRTIRAFTVGPGTYKQCIQTVLGVPQWFPEGTSGIDTSYIVIPGVGNCLTGYDCTGYVPSGSTPTPTPTATGVPPTSTPTPTPTGTATPTPTVTSTPSVPCVCVELNVTGATSGPEPVTAGIIYNNCNSVQVGEVFATNGIRYRCMDYTGGVIQEFGYNGMTISIASGFSCSAGTCPTDIVVTQTPTPTPTATGVPPTSTPTPTPTATGVPPTATPTPTPTATGVPPTSTPTPTATVVGNEFYIGPDYGSALDACNNFDIDPQTPVYAATSSPNAVTQFFTDLGLTTTFTGNGNKYCWAPTSNLSNKWVGNVSNTGNTSSVVVCP